MLRIRKCDVEAFHVWKILGNGRTNKPCSWLSGILNINVVELKFIEGLEEDRFRCIHMAMDLYFNSTMDDLLEEYKEIKHGKN